MQTSEWRSWQPPKMRDGVVVQQALPEEQKAFAILVDWYHTPLFRLIFHFLEHASLANDVLQEVFLQLYLSLPSIRTNASLRPWLLQVASHRCMDQLRRKHLILFSLLDLAEDEHSPFAALPDLNPLPEELVEQREIQLHLQRAIQGLPARLRSVVLLRYRPTRLYRNWTEAQDARGYS